MIVADAWWMLSLVGGGIAKKVSRLLPTPGGVAARLWEPITYFVSGG